MCGYVLRGVLPVLGEAVRIVLCGLGAGEMVLDVACFGEEVAEVAFGGMGWPPVVAGKGGLFLAFQHPGA